MFKCLRTLNSLISNTHFPSVCDKYFHVIRNNDVIAYRTISCTTKCKNIFVNDEETPEKRKKTARIPKITLIYPNNTKVTVTLQEAQRLAKRRNLALVRTPELDELGREGYTLFSSADIYDKEIDVVEEVKQKNIASKKTKLIVLNASILDHDLRVKINLINRLVEKGHKVKMLINVGGIGEERIKDIISQLKTGVNGSFTELPKSKTSIRMFVTPTLGTKDTK